jgi:hypothetical protein
MRLNRLMLLVLASRFGKCALCSPANPPFFGLKSGAAKNAEKRITRLKVVWILRILFATGNNAPETGKQVKASA